MLGEGKTHTHPREGNTATYARECVYTLTFFVNTRVCMRTFVSIHKIARWHCVPCVSASMHSTSVRTCVLCLNAMNVALLVCVLVLWHNGLSLWYPFWCEGEQARQSSN